MTDGDSVPDAPVPDAAVPGRSAPGWLTLDMMIEAARGTLVERMGIECLEISADRAVARMPVEGNIQPYGLLHGGASVVLAESLGSFLAVNLAGRDRTAVGIEINATHHRPVTSGWVTGVATPIAVGRTVASFDIVITDDQGRRTCTSRFTAQLRDAPPSQR